MPSTDDQDARLAELEARWEADPGSRVFVQLADEYRRQGRLADAIEVLEKGLKAQPHYVTAQVALGRCHLEAGDTAEALILLESAVVQDPTHLLANKLMVESYLRTGQTERARKRLDLCRLISSDDPELESLEERLTGAGPAVAEIPEEAGEALETVAVPFATLETEAEAAGAPAAASTSASDDPFGDLWTGDDLNRWGERFSQEGIFRWTPAPTAEEAPTEPAAVVAGEGGNGAAATAAADLEAAAESGEDATVTLGQLYMAQGHDEEAARIFRRVLERDPENRISREALGRLEAQSVAARSATAPAESPAPDAALVEAPEVETPVIEAPVVGAVPAETPELEAPWAGPPPPPAASRAAEPPTVEDVAAGPGLTGRKIATLQHYLQRLRQAVENDVS